MEGDRDLDPNTSTSGVLPAGGARTGPDVPDQNWVFQRHVAIYRHVAARITGTVVDAGCGEGYGLRILSEAGARGVIGVDDDEDTVLHARGRYANERIEVVEADLADLPLVLDTMDAVVAVHAVDRVPDLDAVLAELVRITRPGGSIAVATPNRPTWLPAGWDEPTGPFQLRMFTADALRATMETAEIGDVRIEGVRHTDAMRDDLAPLLDARPLATLADPTSWHDDLRRRVHTARPEHFEVTADDLDTCIDLVAWGKI